MCLLNTIQAPCSFWIVRMHRAQTGFLGETNTQSWEQRGKHRKTHQGYTVSNVSRAMASTPCIAVTQPTPPAHLSDWIVPLISPVLSFLFKCVSVFSFMSVHHMYALSKIARRRRWSTGTELQMLWLPKWVVGIECRFSERMCVYVNECVNGCECIWVCVSVCVCM